MTGSTLCHDCGAVLTDGTAICPPCRDTLATDISGATDLLVELDTTLARMDKVSAVSAGGKSAVKPLPYSVGASLATSALRRAIRAMGTDGITHTTISRFRQARDAAWHVVDLPDPRVLLGVCGCGRSVYARTGDATVVCGCGEAWDVVPLDALDEVRKLAGTVQTIRQWLQFLGVVRSQAQVYRDVAPLTPITEDPRTYSLAEVHATVLAKQARRSA